MNGMQVEFRLKGLSVERLLNEARKAGVPLRAVRRLPGRELLIRCQRRDYAALSALAREKGYAAGPARPVGALRLFFLLRRRWPLLAGAVAAAALTAYSLGFVWRIGIENAGRYEGEIRAYLEETGVRPGIRRRNVDLGVMRDQLEWRLPAVAWVRCAWRGVELVIGVEEGAPPPAMEARGAPGDIVASQDALVTRVLTYAGTAKVKPGDFVREGQVLIAGVEKGKNGEETPVKARGEVAARVWQTARTRCRLTQWRSVPTGRKMERRVWITPFFTWSSEEEPAYLTADRTVTERKIGRIWLPVSVRRETYEEVRLEKEARDGREALAEAEAAALSLLSDRLKNAETVDKWINFRMIEGDTIVVEAAGEMIRPIGRYRKNVP